MYFHSFFLFLNYNISGLLTVHELLKVIHEKFSQRRSLRSFQRVEQLLDFGGDAAVDWNTYTMALQRGWDDEKSGSRKKKNQAKDIDGGVDGKRRKGLVKIDS